jgi:hypothetical protein
MIFYLPVDCTAAQPVAVNFYEHSVVTSHVYHMEAGCSPPSDLQMEGARGDEADLVLPECSAMENFDWSNKKIMREYIQLEQKFLAKKASADESKRYSKMKRDRNSYIFADRYIRDYAEVERLKKLSKTLVELQKYLKPVSFQ